MVTKHDTATLTLDDLQHIPVFATEAEEAEFWDSHTLGDDVLAAMGPIPDGELPPPRAPTRAITIYLDEPTIARVKALARRQHTRYQRLLTRLVLDRLAEEEKREGLAG